MELEDLIGFNLALLAAMASPGPAFLYQLKSTLGSGRAAGIATGCGLGAMAATWTLVALVGLDGLFQLFPEAYTVFRVAGACYLLYLAWNVWRGASETIIETATPNSRAFLGGFFVNLANPKSVFFAAVLVLIFPPDLSIMEKVLVVGNHLAVEVVVYSSFAFLLSTRVVSQRYLRLKPVLDRIAAALLGGLGVRLMLDR